MFKLLASFATGIVFAASLQAADIPSGYKLLYEQNFDSLKDLRGLTMTDSNAWKLSAGKSGQALELAQQSKYKPAHRSPVNIALISDKVFGDFILEADMVQTGREYGHRDMCIFFGVTDPSKFYYVHMATAADPNAHNVFLVKDAPRKNFAKETTKGVNWGLDVWHKVRLERKGSSIKVFFDDMEKPIMVAEDANFTTGHIGFGSFDDTGKIDNIKIWGTKVEDKPSAKFFSSK